MAMAKVKERLMATSREEKPPHGTQEWLDKRRAYNRSLAKLIPKEIREQERPDFYWSSRTDPDNPVLKTKNSKKR